MGNYLIPANTKKSQLKFGLFTTGDLILFGSGMGLSIILLAFGSAIGLNIQNVTQAIIAILPGLTTGFLVLPLPNYHNMLTVIRNCIDFFTNNQKYVWKGWCVNSGQEPEQK